MPTIMVSDLDLMPDVEGHQMMLEPAGPVTWLPSVFISGPKYMPVRFTPRRVGTIES
ncbi:MAG TPA: hypothetical protein VF942_01905 [Acidimicrobiales bacterium]